jgi:hypothetical protein
MLGQRLGSELPSRSIRYHPIILTEAERPLHTSINLSTVFGAKEHPAEGQY